MFDKQFKVHTFFSYLSNGSTLVVGLLLMVLINRNSGVDIYGALAIISSSSGMIAALMTARSGEAVNRFFVRERTKGRIRQAKTVVQIGLLSDFILGLLAFGFFYLLSDLVAQHILKNQEYIWEIRLFALITLFALWRSSLRGFFQSHEQFVTLNVMNAAEPILKLMLVVGSFYVLGIYTLDALVISYVLATGLVTGVAGILFWIRYRKEFKTVNAYWERTLIREYIGFNIKTFVSSSLKAGNGQVDNLILGYFTDNRTVGIYQSLKNFILPLNFLGAPFYMMTNTKLIRFYTNQEYGQFHWVIKSITTKIVLIGVLVIVGFYLMLPYLMRWLKVPFDFSVQNAFAILALMGLLNLSIWWGRSFINLYNPTIPIYTNALLLFNSVFIPVILFNLSVFQNLVTIAISNLLAFFISWLIGMVIYVRFMNRRAS